MKTLFNLLVALALPASLNAIIVDFNDPADLAANFTVSYYAGDSGESLPLTYLPTGGLNGSGAIGYDEHVKTQAIVYGTGFTVEAGKTYTVSTYLKGYVYNGVGFTSGTSVSLIYLPTTSISYIGYEADNLWVTNYAPSNTGDTEHWEYANSGPGSYADSDWLFRSLSLTYNGSDTFDVSYVTYVSDSSGTLGEIASQGTFQFVNADIVSSGLYPYLFWDQGSLAGATFDSFSASVPEPSAYAAFAGLGVLLLALRRRK